jgi:tetratricopeptide (TPR) repeat protein
MEDLTPLERAVDQLVDQLLRGASVDVDAFLARHPDVPPAEAARLVKLARVLGDRPLRTPVPGALPYERLGAYKLLERLGAGGMGIVYLAVDERLDRRVALKVVRPELAASAETLARFEREARAVAKLSHDHIVSVFEAGRVDDVAFLAMEFVPGQSLDALFAEARAARTLVPMRELLRYGLEVARALSAAHAAGIVHRDVKPSNVRVTPDGRALLLDFGLAIDTSSATLSRTGQVQGTLYYASPEQVAGGSAKIDARTDVWSLGVTLYEGLTGRRPFEGERTEEVLHRIVSAEPVAPRALVPDLPRDVETVVLKALEKSRDARYPSAAAFAADLEALLAGRHVAARASGPVAKAWKWARRKPAHALALALTTLLLVGGPLIAAVVQARHARALTNERNIVQERSEEIEELANFQGKVIGRVRPERLGGRVVEGLEREARAAWIAAGATSGEVEERARSLRSLLAGANSTNVAVDALRRDVIEPAAEAAHAEFASRPRVLGRLLRAIGATAWAQGQIDLALTLTEDAFELLSEHAEPGDSDRLLAEVNLGQLLFERGRAVEAEPHLHAAVAGLLRTLGPDDARTLLAQQNLATFLHSLGRFDECQGLFESVLATRRRAFGDTHEGTVQAIANLGALYVERGRLEEGEKLLREAYECDAAKPRGDLDSRLRLANNLGVLQRNLGRLDDAAEVLGDAVELARHQLGDRNPTTAALRMNLAQVLVALGRLAEAEPMLRESAAVTAAIAGPLHVDTLTRIARHGEVLLELGRTEEALTTVQEPWDAAREAHGVDAAPVQRLAAVEVRALVALGRHAAAAAVLGAARPSKAPEKQLTEAAEALFTAAPAEVAEPARRVWVGAE